MLINKSKNLFFILAALALRPFKRTYRGPQRILIFQGAKLGDMVCTTPLFRAVKLRYPHAYLAVMGTARNGELLAGHPYVDEYLIRPKGFFELLHVLRLGRFDAACSIVPDPEVLSAFVCARIPLAVTARMSSSSPYETMTARVLQRCVTTVPHHMGSYVPREYLRVLEPLGIHTDDVRKELAVSKESLLHIGERLSEKGYDPAKDLLLGIAPGAGNKIKTWKPENFAHVAGVLAEKYAVRLVPIGGVIDREEINAMLHALPPSVRVLDLSETLSVEQLKALISLLHLFIANDTGPVHIAEAFAVPSVDVLGAVDEHETFLSGPTQRAVFAPNRGRPALHVMSSSVYDLAEVRRQTQMVTVNMVLVAAEELLSSGVVENVPRATLPPDVH